MTKATAAATANEDNAFKPKDDLAAASTEFTAHFIADNATGTITLPADTVFASNVAKQLEVTEDSYAKHRQFEDLVSSSLTYAGTVKAVEMFKENKDLQTVTLKAPIHKKTAYEGTFNRHGSSRNPKDNVVTNYVGSIGAGRITVVSTRSGAEQKAIKDNFKAMALAAGLE